MEDKKRRKTSPKRYYFASQETGENISFEPLPPTRYTSPVALAPPTKPLEARKDNSSLSLTLGQQTLAKISISQPTTKTRLHCYLHLQPLAIPRTSSLLFLNGFVHCCRLQ